MIGGLRQVGDDLKKENGVSIAQCEFWSDTLDRWAEDLVDPTGSGKCPGSKSRSSLPPSIVLEVLKILEGEINLREETRVAEQARPALESKDHAAQAGKLSETQKALDVRVEGGRRQDPRAPRRRGRVRLRDRPPRRGLGRHGRGRRDPRRARDRRPGDRRGDGGHRAAAQVAPDQPERGRRRRIVARRRRDGHHERLGPGPDRGRVQREGRPRRPRRLAGRPATPGRRSPRSSARASTSISTAWRAGPPAVDLGLIDRPSLAKGPGRKAPGPFAGDFHP